MKTTPKWEGGFRVFFHFLKPFFSLGAHMGSQGPSRPTRRWFSGGLGIVFAHFLLHLSTHLKRKSTVAEQRGCALDKKHVGTCKLSRKKETFSKMPRACQELFHIFSMFRMCSMLYESFQPKLGWQFLAGAGTWMCRPAAPRWKLEIIPNKKCVGWLPGQTARGWEYWSKRVCIPSFEINLHVDYYFS